MLVISNGYDLSHFRPNVVAGPKIRDEFGIEVDQFLLGMVGRYDPVKDHGNLLDALALVKKEGFKVRCILVGRGLSADNAFLFDKIITLGLKDSVFLAGARVDIPAIMNALDLHVLASSSEGFPNVLAEAMACGTPCISTDVGDAREILADNDCICPPRDSRALAERLIKMYREARDDPHAWQARSISVSQKISTKYSLQKMVSAYEACWFGSVNS